MTDETETPVPPPEATPELNTDLLIGVALPIVYKHWCKENNIEPMMGDPLDPEFRVLAVQLIVDTFEELVKRKDEPC